MAALLHCCLLPLRLALLAAKFDLVQVGVQEDGAAADGSTLSRTGALAASEHAGVCHTSYSRALRVVWQTSGFSLAVLFAVAARRAVDDLAAESRLGSAARTVVGGDALAIDAFGAATAANRGAEVDRIGTAFFLGHVGAGLVEEDCVAAAAVVVLASRCLRTSASGRGLKKSAE